MYKTIIFALCSIVIVCLYDYPWVKLRVDECPFCFGTDFCSEFKNVVFNNLSFIEHVSNVISIKNVKYGRYKNQKIVLKVTKSTGTHNGDKIDGLQLCTDSVLDTFYNLLVNDVTNRETLSWISSVNVEPLMLQLLKSTNGWPVPNYHGACGMFFVEEYSGETISFYFNKPWIFRAGLALQLLEAARDFTGKHPELRFYLTDISPDNVVVNSENKIRFVDLEDVIIAHANPVNASDVHKSEHIECENCFAYSRDDICNHGISDHNYYAVCQIFLSKTAPWPTVTGGLLHSIPNDVLAQYPELPDYVERCAEGGNESTERFKMAEKLQNILSDILFP